MTQYFQLTPEILLEYVYDGDPKLDLDGVDGNDKNICSDNFATILLRSDAFSSKYLCFKNDQDEYDESENRIDCISNLVLPLNNTETQFVIVKGENQNFYKKTNASNIFSTKKGIGYMYEDTQYDKDIIKNYESFNVKYDKCIVHFTSRNYFGNYDSLIFQSYVYMKNKAKLYLSSFLFKKTSNLYMKSEHMLYNEKLYTTQIEFDIPSTSYIFSKKNRTFNSALESQNVNLLENTPIGINLYGVSGSLVGTDNYTRLNTLKIGSISIPFTHNNLDEIVVDIFEAQDGDYYYIDPRMSDKYKSFVEYIESMGEDIRSYMVMHELSLLESWVDEKNITHSEITHKEFHIIDINEDDEDEEISERFDAKIKYRPICVKSGNGHSATIIDKIKVMNIVDNSSYEVTASKSISNPYKYGKWLKRLGIKNESRPIVNVYNKPLSTSDNSGFDSTSFESALGTISGTFNGKNSGSNGSIYGNVTGNIPGFGKVTGSINAKISDCDIDSNSGDIKIEGPINISLSGSAFGGSVGLNNGGVVVLNKNGGFIVENNTKNITSFIECTNVGVSIVELSPDDIN